MIRERKYQPMPPEKSGWYCVNFFADLSETDPGHLICAPEIVWWDINEYKDKDPVVVYPGSGVQGIDCIAIWGSKVEGLPDWNIFNQ